MSQMRRFENVTLGGKVTGMTIILFLALAVLFVGLAWITIAAVMFAFRLATIADPEERVQFNNRAVALVHIFLSLGVGLWVAWRLAMH